MTTYHIIAHNLNTQYVLGTHAQAVAYAHRLDGDNTVNLRQVVECDDSEACEQCRLYALDLDDEGIRVCEWGICEWEATEIVKYPARIPGGCGERSWLSGVETCHYCPSCAVVARDEIATMPREYILSDPYGAKLQIEATTDADAREQARDWAECGDYSDATGTIYVDVRIDVVNPDGNRVYVDTVTVIIPQTEPDCEPNQTHDWVESDVSGHGGGIVQTDTCKKCGCQRITDTWATRMDTGDQGFREVTYRQADED